MDSQGNAVAMTQSIERSFGSCEITPELGFLYNGFLRSFKVVNQRHPHYLRPGAPARSNAAPTLVLRQGKPWAALGSTGSERLASGIFQVLLRLGRQGPFEAVHAPRLHATPEELVLLEADRFPAACLEALERHGFSLERLEPYSFRMGGLQLVVREDEAFRGVGEPRRDGAAAPDDTK
jgi:gamma-glutamyltranspeptidase/glutathione hydrolase